jgi:hypothetical protein
MIRSPGLSTSHISPRHVSTFAVADELRTWREVQRTRIAERSSRPIKRPKRFKVERLIWAEGGDVMKIEAAALYSKPPMGCVRGKISEFSHEARHRLMVFVNSINREKLPPERIWFTTLTYPGIWPGHPDHPGVWVGRGTKRRKLSAPQVWKRHLQAFQKRIQRTWGVKMPAIWKLEPQKRGAPHFHLLLLVPAEWCRGLHVTARTKRGERIVTSWAGGLLSEFRQWLSAAWFEIVGSDDRRHLAAGTNCEPIEAWGKIAAYASKYLGKECGFRSSQGEPIAVGRYWGVWQREAFQIQWRAEAVPFAVAARARRVVRKLIERRWTAKHLNGRFRSATVFLPAPTIRRVVKWATDTVENELVREFGSLATVITTLSFVGSALEWYRFGEYQRRVAHQRRRATKL